MVGANDKHILETPVGRMNPITKAGVALFVGLTALILPISWLGFVFTALYFIAAAKGNILKPFAKIIFSFGIPITLMLLFIQGFYSPLNKTFILDCGFAKLGLEGVLNMLHIVGTLLTFLAGLYILNQTTYIGRLVAALNDIGMSPKAGYLTLATLNVVPQMQRRMHGIQEAQSARGLSTGGSALERFKAFIPLLGPVVLSSLTDAQERGMTLETHGFGLKENKHTSLVTNTNTPTDKVILYGAAVLFVVAVVLTVLNGVGIIAIG